MNCAVMQYNNVQDGGGVGKRQFDLCSRISFAEIMLPVIAKTKR